MSLLTPERVPVKVYKWDDVGAPQLDKTPNCMAIIFKACLVTGYGTKDGAGWTMPFEDMTAGIKVFKPPSHPGTDFYFQLSADDGQNVTPKVFFNMTSAKTGDLKLNVGAPLGYGWNNISGKWILFVSPYGIKFFYESASQYGSQVMDRSGGFLFMGLMASDIIDNNSLFLQHSVTTNNNIGDHAGLFLPYAGGYKVGVFLENYLSAKKNLPIQSQFLGYGDILNKQHLAYIYAIQSKTIYFIPGLFTVSKTSGLTNFAEIAVPDDSGGTKSLMVLGVSSFSNEFVCVELNSWVY